MCLGLASIGITAVSLVPAITVAPIVLTGTVFAGASCAAYSFGRSIYNLVDGSKHRQSNPDPEARAAYLTIAGSVLCAAAAGASQILSVAAARGREITRAASVSVNILNGSSIVMNAFTPVDGIVNIVIKLQNDNPNEQISTMEVVQICGALFMLKHSVDNFRSAQSIIETSRNSSFEAIRQNLTKSQKKGFNKIVKETFEVRGVEAGQQDIIRAFRKAGSPQFK